MLINGDVSVSPSFFHRGGIGSCELIPPRFPIIYVNLEIEGESVHVNRFPLDLQITKKMIKYNNECHKFYDEFHDVKRKKL